MDSDEGEAILFNPVVTLTDRQWADFIYTMNNPKPPTELMRQAHKFLDELRALRDNGGGSSCIDVNPIRL